MRLKLFITTLVVFVYILCNEKHSNILIIDLVHVNKAESYLILKENPFSWYQLFYIENAMIASAYSLRFISNDTCNFQDYLELNYISTKAYDEAKYKELVEWRNKHKLSDNTGILKSDQKYNYGNDEYLSYFIRYNCEKNKFLIGGLYNNKSMKFHIFFNSYFTDGRDLKNKLSTLICFFSNVEIVHYGENKVQYYTY